MSINKKTVVLIPSYEPDDKLPALIQELCGVHNITTIVVNDGSDKKYSRFFDSCAEISGCTVLGYEKNHGKGYALKYGFSYIIDNLSDVCDCIVTADSDGQHKPADILRVADAVRETPGCLVLGSRDCLMDHVPARSRIGNRVTRGFFGLVSGCHIKDTQTGLRGFSLESAKAFADTEGDRFEYEMRVLIEAKTKNIKIREIPIETVYEADRTTHYNTWRDSVRIFSVFIGHIGKYFGASMLCYLIELIIYSAIYMIISGQNMFVFKSLSFAEAVSNTSLLLSFISARVISASVNFTLNRNVVFKAKGRLAAEIAEYTLLVVVVAALTYLLIILLTWIGISGFLAHPISTMIMFFASYFVQRKIIFKKK